MYYIYEITNNINGKTYVGQHKYTNINDSYMGSGKILREAFDKYGKENFTKEILISGIPYKEVADHFERFYISLYRQEGKCEYNIADGGQGGNLGEEVNRKLSEANKGENNPNYGKHHSDEAKQKISDAEKGKVISAETRAKMSEAKKNISAETRQKLSDALKGRHLSDETRKKISDGKKNISAETRKKLSEAIKGKHHSAETRVKISEARKGENNPFYGKHHSAEARAKMSDASKKYWEQKRSTK